MGFNHMKNFQKRTNQKISKAFTLIELLIVIAVIGILVAVILPNLIGMRERAQDTKKKNDLVQIKNALRMYYNDYNAYPQDHGGQICCDVPTGCDTICNSALTVAGQTYTKDLPTTFDFSYSQTYSGEGFLLTVELDNISDQDILTSQERCNFSTQTATTFVVCED